MIISKIVVMENCLFFKVLENEFGKMISLQTIDKYCFKINILKLALPLQYIIVS